MQTLTTALPSDAAAGLALDTNSLAALKLKAKQSPELALGAAAQQFEALFMQQLLKTMRDALPQDGMLDSEAGKTYTAMFDQQIAQQLAKKGMGIADMLVKQLSKTKGTTANPPAAGAAATGTPAADGAPVTAAGAVATLRSLLGTKASAAVAVASATAPAVASAATAATGLVPAGVQSFVDTLRPYADAAAKAAGLPAAFILGQAGLESGWGKHQPLAADGTPSHNLFGIKAGPGWKGAVAEAATTEYVNGTAVTTVEKFRAYGSYTEALTDFAKLVRDNPRYAAAAAAGNDPAAYANAIQKGGYATDPNYATKLARAIDVVKRHAAAAPAQVSAARADNPTNRA
jgi:flagellar protein FlgJ